MYNLFIFLYYLSVCFCCIFSEKAREWVRGCKHIFKNLKKIDHGEGVIWFHCASMGEYEQGLPVIIKTKEKYPNHKILLTFFSPSGYKNYKPIPQIDYVYYMPLDIIINAYRFVNIVRPVFTVFVKYEFWYNTIWVLKEANIPIIYISCNFRKTQYFFKWFGGWFRQRLRKVAHYFVQNEESKRLLESIRIKNVTITGDTRFDRVKEIADLEYHDPVVEKFISGYKVFLAGSTWQPDEILIKKSLNGFSDYKFVIVPHEVKQDNIDRIRHLFNDECVLYSKLSEEGTGYESHILIIDCIGKLSRLYRYSNIAYVGGGFGKGIHNILEAAVYDIPVIFGPKYLNYNEAKDLLRVHGGFTVKNPEELMTVIKELSNDQNYEKACTACGKFVTANVGATQKIISKINTL